MFSVCPFEKKKIGLKHTYFILTACQALTFHLHPFTFIEQINFFFGRKKKKTEILLKERQAKYRSICSIFIHTVNDQQQQKQLNLSSIRI